MALDGAHLDATTLARMRAVPLSGGSKPISRIVMGMSAGPDELPSLYDRYIELGGNAFETARWYPAEPTLGAWLAGRSDRDELVIIGKAGHPSTQDGPPRIHPAEIEQDLLESLERLHTDRIDLLALHRDDPTVPVGAIMTALAEHRAAGRIGATSGSNWTPERLADANAWATANGVPPFDASSPNLSLAVPTRPPWPGCLSAGDAGSLAWYEQTQLPMFAWAPLARGYFTEAPIDTAPIRRHAMIPLDQDIAAAHAFDSDDNRRRRDRARILAHELGITANQVALAWVLNQTFPTWAIVGVRSVAELDECVSAADLALDPDQVRWLAAGEAGAG